MERITFRKIACFQGKEIVLFRLQNASDAFVELINYGATLTSIVVPDNIGNMENIILNYKDIEDYFTDTSYIGSTVGRFANRIANAQFKLNDKTYHLDKNDGQNSNHGGFNGFNKKVFDYKVEENCVVLFLESKDGEGGFPGNIQFSVRYSFSNDNKLTIEYQVSTDKETIFNPTNHAYFNLTAGKSTILNHELKTFADTYLESTDEFLPTGEILNVMDTAFDFRDFRNIGQQSALKKDILKGYNAYFIGKNDEVKKIRQLASLRETQSGRRVDVYSTMPGVQVYTGDYLNHKHKPFGGICLEAQFYPDAPNHPHFPSCVIVPGTSNTQIITYHFHTLKYTF